MPVGGLVSGVEALHAEPPQRLGFPGPRAVVHPGQHSQIGVPFEGQVSQCAAGEVGGRDAMADVAAGQAADGARCDVSLPDTNNNSLAAKRVIEIVNLRKVFNAKPDNKVAVDDISLDMYRPFAPQRVGRPSEDRQHAAPAALSHNVGTRT